MNTTKEIVEVLRDQFDLTDFLEEYTSIRAYSDEIQIKDCPMCGDSRYKVYINTETFSWICHHCKWSGKNPAWFIAGITGKHISTVFEELESIVSPALEFNNFFDTLYSKLMEEEDSEEDLVIWNDVVIPGMSLSTTHHLVTRAENYLASRGVLKQSKRLEARVAMRCNKLLGPFVIFPVKFNDTLVSFQGRRLTNREPRYVSADNIGDWLYPLDEVDRNSPVVLTEGIFDYFGMKTAGINSLCTFGNKLTRNQHRLLNRLGLKDLILAWDPTAYKEIYQTVTDLSDSFNVEVMDLTNLLVAGKKVDPGDACVKDEVKNALVDQITQTVQLGDMEQWYLRSSLYDL